MKFFDKVEKLAHERIELEIRHPDARLKVHRLLRREQTELWAMATDEQVKEYAEKVFEMLREKNPDITFEKCLEGAESARSRAQRSLKNSRSW